MTQDLTSTRQAILQGLTSPAEQMRISLASAHGPANAHTFIRIDDESARQQAARPGIGNAPLAGLSVSIKDLFDVQGQVTAAGSKVLASAAPALADAPAVARLRAAGGALIGRTNMVEFAFSGVGCNPHWGTPAAWDGRYQQPLAGKAGAKARIPGGSSSGGAVSVATGAAFVGLGSDTGGSIRIPAALNGIVGFKSTAARVPAVGALPLSTTLDTVCAMTRSVRDAITVHEILAQRLVTRSASSLKAWRLAVVTTSMLDGLEPAVMTAFERSLRKLREAGAEIEEISLSEIADLGKIQSTGGFSAAESFAWHRSLLDRGAQQYDPRVRARIERGRNMSAWEYIELQSARQAWISAVTQRLARFDAVLSPTLPITGVEIDQVAPGTERDDEFFRVNALLLRNTSVVNMLDGCAISLPCHQPDELPMGLMLWHAADHDDAVLNTALLTEQALQ